MKKSTKQTLGAGLLIGSIIVGVFLYKRGKQPQNVEGLTAGQARRARVIRNFAARRGIDITPKKQVVERVLPNGMTPSYARKYKAWLDFVK